MKMGDASPKRVPNIITKSPRRIQTHPPRTYTRLIAKRNWWDLERHLTSGTGDGIPIIIDERGVITEDSIVHFALRYRAPLHVLKLLAAKFPRCLTRQDSTGKFAIHVACKYGASPSVVEWLVHMSKSSAGAQDPEGKAPIHYVGEFYASNCEALCSNVVYENMLNVVRILREAAPQSFNLEDNEGYNAIEYAIETDADLKVVKTMQRAARDDWREKKANANGKRHEDLAKDVERSAHEARRNVVLSDIDSRYSQDPPGSYRSFIPKAA